MRWPLTLLGRLLSKGQETANAGEDVEKRESVCTVGATQTGIATLEKSVQVSQESKNRTAMWSSNPTSECISE